MENAEIQAMSDDELRELSKQLHTEFVRRKQFKAPNLNADEEDAVIYEAMAQPSMWLEYARRLKQGADLIRAAWCSDVTAFRGERQQDPQVGWFAPPDKYPNYESACVYVMLLGLAFENVAKGIYVCQHPDWMSGKEKRHLHHDTQQILSVLGIPTSEPEKKVLRQLRMFAEWAGRYPIARDTKEQGEWEVFRDNAQELAERLYARLCALLTQNVRSHEAAANSLFRGLDEASGKSPG